MIFPFAGDKANLFHVHSHAGDSNNKIVAMMVRDGAAIVAAFHNMDSCVNHHDNVNNLDNNDNSLQSSNRKLHVVCCFEAQDIDLIADKQRRPFTPTTSCQIHCMGLNFGLFLGVPNWFQDIMTKIMNTPGLEFYQALRRSQGKSSSCLKGMLLYPLKTLAFGVPYSAFVDYFQISIHLEWNYVKNLMLQ